MDIPPITQSPFIALTFVAAPALLTNASSVLALSTINRMLRTRDSMNQLFQESETPNMSSDRIAYFDRQVGRVERQAVLLLRALYLIYIALAAFASATLVTLLGAGLNGFVDANTVRVFAGLGVAMGVVGVAGLVCGSGCLLSATQISLAGLRDEAEVIRARQLRRRNPTAPRTETP